MKRIITAASIAAAATISAGAVHAADSAVESKAFTELAFPSERGTKNFADVAPDASNGNGSSVPAAEAAQGGRDAAVFGHNDVTTIKTGPFAFNSMNSQADSAVESRTFTNLAYPANRGTKNFATVAPDAANGNGSTSPTTAAEQGGRDAAVFAD